MQSHQVVGRERQRVIVTHLFQNKVGAYELSGVLE